MGLIHGTNELGKQDILCRVWCDWGKGVEMSPSFLERFAQIFSRLPDEYRLRSLLIFLCCN